MYSKFHLIEEAEMVFRLIVERDVILWNTLIIACCHCDDESNVLSVFREIVMDTNVKADDFTYASVLSTAAGLASMCHGRESHAHLIRTRSVWDVGVGNALVNINQMYISLPRPMTFKVISQMTVVEVFDGKKQGGCKVLSKEAAAGCHKAATGCAAAAAAAAAQSSHAISNMQTV
ncbi:unnamed protein product [Fraxinus pennsylvanica]|uniref:Uncharacterized protein n=1 Tax=Fraxinus pennsylvanica TaxID=56036 RepID=A0AAD2E3D1_9LAMI|nr:unnamed protein product [Fraxinus pennsylvanica]